MIFDPTEINSKDTVSNAVKSLKGIDASMKSSGLLRAELEKECQTTGKYVRNVNA